MKMLIMSLLWSQQNPRALYVFLDCSFIFSSTFQTLEHGQHMSSSLSYGNGAHCVLYSIYCFIHQRAQSPSPLHLCIFWQKNTWLMELTLKWRKWLRWLWGAFSRGLKEIVKANKTIECWKTWCTRIGPNKNSSTT